MGFVTAIPRGSKYPNSRVSGSQIHTLNGFRHLNPPILALGPLGSYDLQREDLSVEAEPRDEG